MKILFIFARPTPYDSRTVRDLPCGGTEKAVIFLGEALAKLGHEVEWVTTPNELTAGLNCGFAADWVPDVVITQVAELFQYFPECKKVWWTHHFSDQPVIQQNVAFARAYADKIVTLSKCHAQDFSTSLRLDSVTIGHGVWPGEVQTGQKDPYRLIYASTPFRGLDRIPALFRSIKEHEPRATIAIASSMRTYGDDAGDEQYQGLFRELEGIEGVELLGSLNQEALYREYARASIFFYPCAWPETYCLALDEAIAHGCDPVTTGLAALSERTYTHADQDQLIAWTLMHMRGDNQAVTPKSPRDWLDVARQWEAEILA